MYLINFFYVLFNTLLRKKHDHFLSFKYSKIKKFYGEKCLDIGSGYGHFTDFLKSQNHHVFAIDVVDKFKYDHDFSTFNGKEISLEDDAVNTSVLMFVLHHTDDQIQLLKETARVTKDYIIIGEDVMKSRLDKALGKIHLNTSPWSKSSDLFHSLDGWKKIFRDLNLELIETVDIARNIYPVYPVSRNVFVLKVP